MKQFVKNILAVGITTALSLSLVATVQAATYKIVDKGAVSELKNTYAQQQNNNGVVAISGTNLYNFPVQYLDKDQNQYLDDDDFQEIKALAESGLGDIYDQKNYDTRGLEAIENYDAMVAGDPTANDLAWIVIYLQRKTNVSTQSRLEDKRQNFYYQQVGDTVAMTNLGAGEITTDFPVFDKTFDGTVNTDLTRSTVDIITGITDSGITYGSATAPYFPEAFTEKTKIEVDGELEYDESQDVEVTYWLSDFEERGFFSFDNGVNVFPVVPEESKLGGGVSAVLDVNENGTAVGHMSYELIQDTVDIIEDDSGGCADSEILDKMPPEICEQINRTSMYPIVAYSTTLNTNGEVVPKRLGLLIDKSNQSQHPDDERFFSSRALAINNNGVAVGYADGWDDGNVTSPAVAEKMRGAYAVMFKNGYAFDFNQKHADERSISTIDQIYSQALDINDNGLAVGYIYNNSDIKKFFYVDTSVSEDEMEMITPDDFFGSSDSTAYAVNNDGFIVGEGEIETHNESTSQPRRTAAFIYDSENDIFSNINDLTACDSPYTIIEARDINDEGVISATAIFKEDRFDAKGKLVVDENDNPVKEDVVRAVVLEPIADDGQVCPEKEEDKVERQGASFGLFGLLSLLALISLRRRTT